MGKESGNEMEQIQRSLEQFLDREVARYEKQESRNTERRYAAGEETADSGRRRRTDKEAGYGRIDNTDKGYGSGAADYEEEYQEEYSGEEYLEGGYPEEEYSEDECPEEEYPEDDNSGEEYSENEYYEDEYFEENYPEGEYPDEDHYDKDVSFNEYPEDEEPQDVYTNRRFRGAPYPEEEYGDNLQEKYVRHGKKETKQKTVGRRSPDRTGPEPGKPPKKQKTEKEKGGGMKENKSASGKKKNSGEKKKSGFRKFLTVLIVLLALLGAVWYVMVGHIYGKMRYSRVETLAGEPLKEQGVVNILLIGSDSRTAGDEGRSDAMILLSISDKTRTIHMTSLLRDMYVDIPGREGNRLNAAYSFGGPELLLETVKQNLGIDVNRYAVVNFQAFANLVDAVNGVDMELTNDEVQWVNAYLNEYNELRGMPIDTDYLDTSLSGTIHLNGPQALAYSRNRFIGTDFGRTERQRKVLAAVMKKLPVAAVTNPGGLIDGLFPNLTTNLTQAECMRLSLMAGKLLTYELVQESIPLEGTYSNASIRGMDVLQVDFGKNSAYLRAQLYGENAQ